MDTFFFLFVYTKQLTPKMYVYNKISIFAHNFFIILPTRIVYLNITLKTQKHNFRIYNFLVHNHFLCEQQKIFSLFVWHWNCTSRLPYLNLLLERKEQKLFILSSTYRLMLCQYMNNNCCLRFPHVCSMMTISNRINNITCT